MTTKADTLLVVWHSRTGAARQLADAACRGAHGAAGDDEVQPPQRVVQVVCLPAQDADVDAVLAASCYLFVLPENLASMSGVMKEFFDRTYYGVLDRIAGRPYAMIVAAGSDGQGAARQVARIVTGWRLREVAPPLIVVNGAQTPEAILAPKRVAPEALEAARALGAGLAEGLALGVF